MTKSEYITRAVMNELERDGVTPMLKPAAA
jgi:hypothetical protein